MLSVIYTESASYSGDEVIPVEKRAAPFERNSGFCRRMLPSALLGGCFALALLVGCVLALQTDGESVQALDRYLRHYLSEAHENGGLSPSLWTVIWELCRWPLCVFLLGFTSLGAVAIPALFCVRGFLLSYAISSFLHIFGRDGMGAALAVFGISAFLVVPVLFLMASWSFPSAVHLATSVWREQPRCLPLRGGFHTLGCAILLLFAGILLQWSVMPPLLSMLSNVLSL